MAARYREVADQLSREIISGRLAKGERLPGEHKLAQRFEVSRSTVRQALACLQDDGLIETWTGAGSYITYDGAGLDNRLGWSTALARQGVRTAAKVVRLERLSMPELAEALGLDGSEFLAVDRVRSLESGEPISYERSRVPWRGPFAIVVSDGLVGGSLSRTLELHGIRPAGGRETVSVARLSEEEAKLLGQEPGAPFVRTARTVHDRNGRIVERVVSLLHPDHFQLESTFGEAR